MNLKTAIELTMNEEPGLEEIRHDLLRLYDTLREVDTLTDLFGAEARSAMLLAYSNLSDPSVLEQVLRLGHDSLNYLDECYRDEKQSSAERRVFVAALSYAHKEKYEKYDSSEPAGLDRYSNLRHWVHQYDLLDEGEEKDDYTIAGNEAREAARALVVSIDAFLDRVAIRLRGDREHQSPT